ncbi:MAG: hypothetical protein ACOVNU_07640 [Candidatus Kapaibacteriota bacterium]|jgi:hypothetical protein
MNSKLNIFLSSISKLMCASIVFVLISLPSYSQEEMMEEETPTKVEKKEEEKKQDDINDDSKEKVNEKLKFFKEKYEFASMKSFTDVWNSIITALDQINCQVMQKKESQTETGALKGNIQSDFCVFSMAGNNVKDSLEKYSYKLPVIRGAVWENARMQYKFILKENEDLTVNILIKGDLSGREKNVTNEVHFWQSNGIFETQMIDRVKKILGE